MDMSSDGTLLASGSADKNLKIWGLDFGDCHRSLFAHQDSIMAVVFQPNTHYVFTAGATVYLPQQHPLRISRLPALQYLLSISATAIAACLLPTTLVWPWCSRPTPTSFGASMPLRHSTRPGVPTLYFAYGHHSLVAHQDPNLVVVFQPNTDCILTVGSTTNASSFSGLPCNTSGNATVSRATLQ